MTSPLSPEEAWQPLPAGDWNVDAARHFLRRVGWTAKPADVERVAADGPARTLDRMFPTEGPSLAKPESVAKLDEDAGDYAGRLAAMAPADRRALERQEREKSRAAIADIGVRWIQFATQPDNAAFQKWLFFLSGLYVVGADKVPRARLIYQYFDMLARHSLGSAPTLVKAVSRSPAMILYLDLQENRREAPNENFARELFELFLLGEGNYTERDIKESARAFTGYRIRPPGEFAFAPRQHDPGVKTIFGHSGNFTGDDVIDLAFAQPAAGTWMPRKMVAYYLSDTPLPAGHLEVLGAEWRGAGYDLRWLVRRFFGSRLFYQPEFRGNFIKGPVQFYAGLLQDLELDGIPLPRYGLGPLRQMGQVPFYPPNVRGWLGGRSWVNSGSLAARRSLVESVFHPLNIANLTADEQAEIEAAVSQRRGNFTVSDARLNALAAQDPDAAVRSMTGDLLAVPAGPAMQAALGRFIAAGPANTPERLRRVRRALITLLDTPEYQLC